jgi:hypothetical protein
MSRQLTENEIDGMHIALDALIAAAQQDDHLSEGALCLPDVVLRVTDIKDEGEFGEPVTQCVKEYGIELAECNNGKFSVECQWIKYEEWNISWDDEAKAPRDIKTTNETIDAEFDLNDEGLALNH